MRPSPLNHESTDAKIERLKYSLLTPLAPDLQDLTTEEKFAVLKQILANQLFEFQQKLDTLDTNMKSLGYKQSLEAQANKSFDFTTSLEKFSKTLTDINPEQAIADNTLVTSQIKQELASLNSQIQTLREQAHSINITEQSIMLSKKEILEIQQKIYSTSNAIAAIRWHTPEQEKEMLKQRTDTIAAQGKLENTVLRQQKQIKALEQQLKKYQQTQPPEQSSDQQHTKSKPIFNRFDFENQVPTQEQDDPQRLKQDLQTAHSQIEQLKTENTRLQQKVNTLNDELLDNLGLFTPLLPSSNAIDYNHHAPTNYGSLHSYSTPPTPGDYHIPYHATPASSSTFKTTTTTTSTTTPPPSTATPQSGQTPTPPWTSSSNIAVQPPGSTSPRKGDSSNRFRTFFNRSNTKTAQGHAQHEPTILHKMGSRMKINNGTRPSVRQTAAEFDQREQEARKEQATQKQWRQSRHIDPNNQKGNSSISI